MPAVLRALTFLLVLQLAGELLVRGLGWPVPGPVIGMALLFAILLARGGAEAPMQRTAHELLRLLPLFFVPAGVGVMAHLDRLRSEGLAIAVALVASTLLAMAVTALVLQHLLRRA